MKEGEYWVMRGDQLYGDLRKGVAGRSNCKSKGLNKGSLAYLRNEGSLCGLSIASKEGIVAGETEKIVQQRRLW